jgi:carbamoyl-phosphate synthase large subunit
MKHKLNGKRIFVSGGSGVIGRELVDRLCSQGAIVFVGDLKPRPVDWPESIIYRQGDLNHISKDELLSFRPKYFFHLAATFERAIETYEFWEENFHHNIKLSNHLMSLLKECSTLKKVIFASSYLIYDPALYSSDKQQKAPRRLNEQDVIYPRNLTGVAKLLHEIELQFLNEFKGEAFIGISARIFRSYGKHSRDIISRWIRALLKGETIEVYRKETLLDYIYAGDVAEGLVKLVCGKDEEGVVNLGSGKARRISEVLEVLNKHFPNMKTKQVGSDTSFEASEADMTKFRNITGWTPTTMLEETIPMIIDHERQNPFEEEGVAPRNVLVTSVSRKVPMIKAIIKASRKLGINATVHGGDMDGECLGRLFVDVFWPMPPEDHLTVDKVLEYCQSHGITSIIPTRDGELLFWARHKEELARHGVSVMVSDPGVVGVCLDKFLFFSQCKQLAYPAVPTFLSVDEVESSLCVVKERTGAGSRGVGLKLTKDEANEYASVFEQPVFQPYVEGVESSIDMYVSQDGKVKGTIARRRDVVVGGESRVTTTFRDRGLEKMCTSLVEDLGLYGHVLVQVLSDGDGESHVLECNTRFGGASTAGIAAGLDSFYWFLLEANGSDLRGTGFFRTPKELRQVRFEQDLVSHGIGL